MRKTVITDCMGQVNQVEEEEEEKKFYAIVNRDTRFESIREMSTCPYKRCTTATREMYRPKEMGKVATAKHKIVSNYSHIHLNGWLNANAEAKYK